MKKTVKRIACNLLLLFFGFVLGLFLLEAGVRIFGLYNFPKDVFIQQHEILGWGHIPGKKGYWTIAGRKIPVQINSKGLRDREYPYEKDKETLRILVLGDSFTEAFQVPLKDTFCKELERRLNEKYEKVEVLNAGFGGVGTDYALRFFQNEGVKYDPDIVLLAFFGNDIYDNYRSKSHLTREQNFDFHEKGIIPRIKKMLANHSCAYNYIGLFIPRHMPGFAKWLMRVGLLSHQPIGKGEVNVYLQYLIFEDEYDTEMRQAWDLTELLIAKLAEEVKNAGSTLAIVSIPFKEQVYEKVWNAVMAQPGMSRREWDVEKPDHLLKSFTERIGIPFLRLLPVFKKEGEKINLYFIGPDGHWNENGHKLAGEIIAKWLESVEIMSEYDDKRR